MDDRPLLALTRVDPIHPLAADELQLVSRELAGPYPVGSWRRWRWALLAALTRILVVVALWFSTRLRRDDTHY